jgi:hypothetical protein
MIFLFQLKDFILRLHIFKLKQLINQKMLLTTIVSGDMKDVLKQLSDTDESDQDFILAVRYLVEIKSFRALELIFREKDIKKVIDKKVVTLAAAGPLKIFKMFEHLFGESFSVQNHPLITACATDNMQLVKFIVGEVREGNFKTDDPHKLKEVAIKISARKGNIVNLKLLCKTRGHVDDAIAIMLTNGNHHKVPRLLGHPEVDFSVNDFELLKLCAPFIVELMEISRHKSVYSKYDELPADYYRHIVDAAKAKFERKHNDIKSQYEKKILHSSSMIMKTASHMSKEEQDELVKKLRSVIDTGSRVYFHNIAKDESPGGPVNLLPEYPNRRYRMAATGSHAKNITGEPNHSRVTKSARTGALENIISQYKKSGDLQEMVTSVHLHHKPDYKREIKSKKLDKFEL